MANVKCICTGCGYTVNVDQASVGKDGYLKGGLFSAGCPYCAGLIKKLKNFDKWAKIHPECTEKSCGDCITKGCREMGLYL